MTKLIFTAAIVALLSACASMSDGSGMASGMSRSNSTYMGGGAGPNGASGGGP